MKNVDELSDIDASASLPVINEDTSDAELLDQLRKLAKEDAQWLAVNDELNRRANAFDLDRACVELLMSSAFYGTISRIVTKIPTYRIPTAAVTIVNGTFLMLWNPRFMHRISVREGTTSNKQVHGTLMHEFLHLVLGHVTSRVEHIDYRVIGNYAADLSINCMIPMNMLPDGCLVPGQYLKIPDDFENVYRPEDLEQYKRLSEFIASLPSMQAMEWYYTKLCEFIQQEIPELLTDPDWGKPMDQCGADPQQPGDGDQGQSGNIPGGNGDISNVPSSTRDGYGRLGNFDDHTEWSSISDAERSVIEHRIKNILREATVAADNDSKGWSNIPSELQALVRKLISNEVDWRTVLRYFIGQTQRLDRSHTIRRINPRYAYIQPGTKRSRGATINIYIDQSGSVSDDAIALLFGELDGLARLVSFNVYFFDTQVDEDVIRWRRNDKHPAQRHRTGGTDFNAVAAHMDEHASEFDAAIIMTDGECSKPCPTRKQRAWLVIPDHDLMFETDELVIKMSGKVNPA